MRELIQLFALDPEPQRHVPMVNEFVLCAGQPSDGEQRQLAEFGVKLIF